MSICTFFGHKDTPQEIEPILKKFLLELIENKGADIFYVGNQGNFDTMVRKNLKDLKQIHPEIKYAVVLAYMPQKKEQFDNLDYSDTIYPEGLENVPPRYAIVKRNQWMIDQSHYVVTYVTHHIGGAVKFKELAEKKKKTVFNLATIFQNKNNP